MKLVRVTAGLYRNEAGGIHVTHQPWMKTSSEGKCWLVTWTDVFSTKHQARFYTLAEVRQYLGKEKP